MCKEFTDIPYRYLEKAIKNINFAIVFKIKVNHG